MKSSTIVVLGGGMVAGYLSKKLGEMGLKAGELSIVSADTALPYERPPLSKGFLAGKDTEESVSINPAKFYSDHGIEVRLGCEAGGLDASRNALHLRSGEDLGFEKLVIATGARVRRLTVPGAELSGVHYLRSLEDSKRIASRAANAKRAVVIGGGFIAMEVASVLAQKSIETAMIVREDRIWERLFTPPMSRFFENYFAARGVQIVKRAAVREIRGKETAQAVVLTDGKTLECDLVVAGIGVEPVTEPVSKGGIALGDGIVVNEFLETSRPGVYAAGDAANYYDSLFEKRRRVEHWDNAVAQGEHCAGLLKGRRTAFEHVPYFFSDVFDLSYEFWGDSEGADETIERGDLSTGSFSVWWLRQRRLVAAFTMNRPEGEREAAPQWIQGKKPAPVEKLKGSGALSM